MVHEGLTASAGYRPGEVSSELDLAGLAVPANGHDAPPTGPPTALPASQPERKPRRRHLILDVSIITGVVVVYVLSLLGYHYLATAPGPLPAPELGTADGTVVLVRLEQLHPVEHRLDVKVLVMPDDSTVDKRLNVLTTDTSVRLFPHNDLGDLQYPVGKSPAQVATNIEAHGDPGDWPFVARVGRDAEDTERPDNRPDDVVVTLQRAKGPLVFDLGICLVLITLPTLALFVAIQMLTGRRQFLPPFSTWYAAMLFAVVPLRNILPGTPPAGAWIDQAVVIWVLIALAAALVLYIAAWYRHSK